MGAEEPRSVSRSEEVDMDTPRRLRGDEREISRGELVCGSKFGPNRLSGLLFRSPFYLRRSRQVKERKAFFFFLLHVVGGHFLFSHAQFFEV